MARTKDDPAELLTCSQSHAFHTDGIMVLVHEGDRRRADDPIVEANRHLWHADDTPESERNTVFNMRGRAASD
jgi:hypothetical protein